MAASFRSCARLSWLFMGMNGCVDVELRMLDYFEGCLARRN